uniref:Ferritin n=2 Tax=Cyprinus carpio TaxID=7962 RepID=A0A9J8CAJ2_CYPCA
MTRVASLFCVPSYRNMSSQVRQNFEEACEAAINRQINMELYASYVYLSMSYYFDRDDQALHNFAKFFRHQSHEEREHAEKLMKFQNQRGGRIFLQDVKKPEKDEWGSGVEALECALQLEKSVNHSLLELHKLSSQHNDPHMCDFIETHAPPRTAWLSICSTSSHLAKRAAKYSVHLFLC